MIEIIKMIILNSIISGIIFIFKDLLIVCSIIIIGYNIILVGSIISRILNKNNFLSKCYGPWILIYIISVGLLFLNKYIVYDAISGVLRFGHDEKYIFIVTVILSGILLNIFNKFWPKGGENLKEILMDFLIKAFILGTCCVFIYGQIMLFNDINRNNESFKEEYVLQEKFIDEVQYTKYYLEFVSCNGNSCEVIVTPEEYMRNKIGDKYMMNVYKGIFGIEYLKKDEFKNVI